MCAHELGLKCCKCGDRDFVVGVAGGFSGLTWACEPVKGHQSCEAHRKYIYTPCYVFYCTAVRPIRSSHPGQDISVADVRRIFKGPLFCLCCANLSVVSELVAWMQKLIIFCHTVRTWLICPQSKLSNNRKFTKLKWVLLGLSCDLKMAALMRFFIMLLFCL